MPTRDSLIAPSKINLFLRIAEKRDDGYHNIETIFLPLKDLFDIVSIELDMGSEISIFCSKHGVPCDTRNLCYKAASLYLEAASIKTSLKIEIKKNIPLTAGMGGGSSDAAAILLLLQKYFKALDTKTLYKLALRIGADVPFFLNPKPSVAYGVGDILERINIQEKFIVIVCAPQFPVSAQWAYKNICKPSICGKIDIKRLIFLLDKGNYSELLPFIKNDLAQTLYSKFPLLDSIRKELLKFGLDAAEITGSGPTLFGITRDKKTAEKTIAGMRKIYGSFLMVEKSQVAMD